MIQSLRNINHSEASAAPSVVVLMACHNRRMATLKALEQLDTQSSSATLAVVLYEDGSSDGTSAAVTAAFPEVEVMVGDGNAYWSRSMAMAQRYAQALASPDYFLWLNDDVELVPGAVQSLLSTAQAARNTAIVVGALVDRSTSQVTYSAFERTGRRPLQLRRLEPSDDIQMASTFNGNFVLVPQRVYSLIGTVSDSYQHALGDIDYGYRAAAAGAHSLLAAGVAGYCPRNSDRNTWRDTSLSAVARFRALFAAKGLPLRSQTHFLRLHGGHLWPFLTLASYVRPTVRIVATSSRRRCTDLHE